MTGSQRKLISTVLAVVAALVITWLEKRKHNEAEAPAQPPPLGGTRTPDSTAESLPQGVSNAELLAARDSGKTHQWVTGRARVLKTLRDDLEGSKHQRWLIKPARGWTVKISHNIDIAPRVPLKAGDEFEYHGRYEVGEHGAFVHWTHRDPGKRHAGGWIRYRGKTYR